MSPLEVKFVCFDVGGIERLGLFALMSEEMKGVSRRDALLL